MSPPVVRVTAPLLRLDEIPEDRRAQVPIAADAGRKVTVIRGVRYDITDLERWHPGGRHMTDLAVGRDSTIMFESAHVRKDRAEAALRALPVAAPGAGAAFGYDAPNPAPGSGDAETFPTPGKSELYEAIRRRVAKEVLNGEHGRGVPWTHPATVVATFLTAVAMFYAYPSVLTGCVLGCALAWVGTGVQHSANHGSLCKSAKLNYVIGLLDDICPGGSSLRWRYRHHVSHHAYTNDLVLDQDMSSKVLRLDREQPFAWYHAYQWLYLPLLFPLFWIVVQLEDVQVLLARRAHLVNFRGSGWAEVALGLALKAAHFAWLFAVPCALHGVRAMLVPWAAAIAFGGATLVLTFIVSHNVLETAPENISPAARSDWGAWQVESAASWGGRVGSFFTGGLSLQIEHHLFPCVRHNLYADIQPIIKEECAKRGVRYMSYDGLLPIMMEMVSFLREMGRVEVAAPPLKSPTTRASHPIILSPCSDAPMPVIKSPMNVDVQCRRRRMVEILSESCGPTDSAPDADTDCSSNTQ